ncbi:MAG: PIG-L family deacetylase [Acidobacteriota bacterium]
MPGPDPYSPPTTGGLERIEAALAKLQIHKRLMIIAAHPDDEDTTLLALVSRGLGGEAAYLSLSRGDGGQNLIGPELGEGLGLLRSRELQAARRIDGARQYFTRAYDFGYTRSLEETFERWPREVLLEDSVRIVRRFKPQVLVAVFPPDARAGHGQHQASGVVAEEIYELAGDPQAFPHLIEEGLPPWSPQAFYRAAWWNPEGATAHFELSRVEPVGGRSIFQIAMESRSQHRCQDMGMLQPIGPQEGRLTWADGGAGVEGDEPFAGIDTRLEAIAETLPEGEARQAVEGHLARAAEFARAAYGVLTPADLDRVLPMAVELLDALHSARFAAASGSPAADLIDEKIAVASELVAASAGIARDAYTDAELLVPGSDFLLETALWKPPPGTGAGTWVSLDAIELVSPTEIEMITDLAELPERSGWAARFQSTNQPEKGFHLSAFRATVPENAPASVPYFLRSPRDGDLYDWSGVPSRVRGEPFGPPLLKARFHLTVNGRQIVLDREVVHRRRDQAEGEIRRPLRVVPAIEVAVERDLRVWPVNDGETRALEILLTSRAAEAMNGRVELAVPPGWPAVDPVPFELRPGTSEAVRMTVSPPADFAPGSYSLRPVAVVATRAGETRYGLGLPVIEYRHVVPTVEPRPAEVRIAAMELTLPDLGRIGYIRGASDRVPEALAEVGLPVELLAPETLAGGDLSPYDAIVVGSRAYETDAALTSANPRLLDWLRAGGLLLVQYQQYDFVRGAYAPLALDIARPHGRVTDETAAVELLQPDHPVFHRPNRLNEGDWLGWVQERSLYMADTWDEAFTPLLAMADPGGESLRGGLLVAPVGEGLYIYTGLAFFRQLPAGVPGGYRLFANLLALADARPGAPAVAASGGTR